MDEDKKHEDKFNIVKRGYDVTEVNEYINTLESVLTSYKEKDNVIKNAIISAQMAADNIVKNAELEADNKLTKVYSKLSEISQSVSHHKKVINDFQSEYNDMISKYIHKFNESDLAGLQAKLEEFDSFVKSIMSQS